jgi:copper chaperone CopZ
MHRALLVLAFVFAADDDVITVRITFEKMHCDGCKSDLESNLKRCYRTAKSVSVEGDTATLQLPEGAALQFPMLQKQIPGDLKVKSVVLTARGVVSEGKGLTFVPRDTAHGFTLVNREEKPKAEDDQVGLLKKQMGGKNRFEVSGEWKDKEIVLTGFKKTDWKEDGK